MGKIANRQCSANEVNSRRPFRKSTEKECCTNERHSRDSHCRATNARSMRTDVCVLGEIRLPTNAVIRIAAMTLASDSAITSGIPKRGRLEGDALILSDFVWLAKTPNRTESARNWTKSALCFPGSAKPQRKSDKIGANRTKSDKIGVTPVRGPLLGDPDNYRTFSPI